MGYIYCGGRYAKMIMSKAPVVVNFRLENEACKLIRVCHVILTKGIGYDASKMLKDIQHRGEQLKAA